MQIIFPEIEKKKNNNHLFLPLIRKLNYKQQVAVGLKTIKLGEHQHKEIMDLMGKQITDQQRYVFYWDYVLLYILASLGLLFSFTMPNSWIIRYNSLVKPKILRFIQTFLPHQQKFDYVSETLRQLIQLKDLQAIYLFLVDEMGIEGLDEIYYEKMDLADKLRFMYVVESRVT